jgi:putative hydrolase of the HAD superfamily
LELVLFDLDGTLVDHDGAEHDAVTGWIRDAGMPTSLGAVPSEQLWHDLAEDAFVEYRAGRLTFQEQRRQRVSRFLPLMGVDASKMTDAELDSEFQQYLQRYEASWRPYSDAVSTLIEVGRTYRVAVLSNGDHAQQENKITRTGLGGLIYAIITSSDLGVAKPDSRAFTMAASRLGVAPGAAAYCGDRLDVDARAATAAGLFGVWLNRAGETPEALDVPAIVSLIELPSVLADGSRVGV